MTDFTFIDIYDNPQLSNCAIQAVCNSVGGVIINNNAPGCNTVEEIEISCLSGLSTLAGSVTVDLNCDDMIDIFDTKVPSHLIAFSPGLLPFAMTKQAGDYLRYLQQNTTFVF